MGNVLPQPLLSPVAHSCCCCSSSIPLLHVHARCSTLPDLSVSSGWLAGFAGECTCAGAAGAGSQAGAHVCQAGTDAQVRSQGGGVYGKGCGGDSQAGAHVCHAGVEAQVGSLGWQRSAALRAAVVRLRAAGVLLL